MKLIKLSQGQFAKVSDYWFKILSCHKWCARYCPAKGNYYAQRTEYVGNCRAGKVTIQMHRVIMGFKPRDGKRVDHRNGDTLDNRDHNLRDGTKGNEKSRARNLNNKLGIKGVHWVERLQLYKVQIQSDGIKHHLGYYRSKRKAALAYRAGAIKYHGKFAKWK